MDRARQQSPMSEEDLYAILGVEKTSEQWLIRLKYRAMMRRYHPDGGTDPDTAKAQRINQAYEVLSDPERRRRYDAKMDTDDQPPPWPSAPPSGDTARRKKRPSRPTKAPPRPPFSETAPRNKPVSRSTQAPRRPAFSDTAIIFWLLAFCLSLIAFLYFQR